VGELVAKSAPHRVSSAVLYEPDTPDAHGEFVERDELLRAVIDYAEAQDKTLRLQHQDATDIGEVTAVVVWPAALPAELCTPTFGCSRKSLKPGTAFAITRWSAEAWPLVEAGEIRGLSMGGTAVRVRDRRPAEKSKGGACSCGGDCSGGGGGGLSERARIRLARGLVG
jgi:hypothetical protein